MKNKMKLITKIAIAFVLSIGIFSCSDDEVKLASLTVLVETSADFTGLDLTGLTVTMTNSVDNSTSSTTTDATGLAMFINVAPGTYSVACTLALTAEEASEASGYYEEITLNGVENDVNLFGGVESTSTLVLDGKPSSSLIIKEFYYNGANDPMWGVLFKDQFVEIYNNSSEVVYADGLYVASLAPTASGSSANDVALGLDLTESVYADKLTQIPGNGTDYPIQPGECIIIAYDAVDWTNDGANSAFTVDLSNADFEMYAVSWLESLGRTGSIWFDVDNVDVTNMNCIYLNIENYGSLNFNPTAASIAILNCETAPSVLIKDPNSSDTSPIYYIKLNTADIIDGADFLYNGEAAAFKRLPTSVDAGFNFVTGNTYTSQSMRRKVAKVTDDGRKVLMDTNNSTNDFEVISLATPGGFGE
ncbi:DUF4876 domain-containing protein [Mangrovibacterium sp.]|uniref:DUF4876 domain-containing protein n=1 Tax=Mangrovibacterium sp. TaxID=1961364 RepID=UPI003562B8A7